MTLAHAQWVYKMELKSNRSEGWCKTQLVAKGLPFSNMIHVLLTLGLQFEKRETLNFMAFLIDFEQVILQDNQYWFS